MTEEDWKQGYVRCLGVRLAGDRIEEKDHLGNSIHDDTFLLLINAHHEPIRFTLPSHPANVKWHLVLDTVQDIIPARAPLMAEGDYYDLKGRSFAMMEIETAVPIHPGLRGFPSSRF
jgi:glycogen operon protein